MDGNTAWKQAVGMAAAICLRSRSHYMNGVQLLISIFGYHSNWMVRIAGFVVTYIYFSLILDTCYTSTEMY